jgi:hypothetical protein
LYFAKIYIDKKERELEQGVQALPTGNKKIQTEAE